MTLAVILVPLKLTLGGADGFTDTVGCSLGASAFHGTIHKFVSVSLCCFVAVYCSFAGVLDGHISLMTKFPEYIWNSLSFSWVFQNQQIPWYFQVFQSCKHPVLPTPYSPLGASTSRQRRSKLGLHGFSRFTPGPWGASWNTAVEPELLRFEVLPLRKYHLSLDNLDNIMIFGIRKVHKTPSVVIPKLS